MMILYITKGKKEKKVLKARGKIRNLLDLSKVTLHLMLLLTNMNEKIYYSMYRYQSGQVTKTAAQTGWLKQ